MTAESTNADDATRRDGSRLSEGLGPLPEPVAWFRAPYGTLEPNPLFRVTGPQSLEWAVACFTEYQLRAAVAAERERIERDVADLHMTQATNNQNCPRAWHDGIDAALAVIRGA